MFIALTMLPGDCCLGSGVPDGRRRDKAGGRTEALYTVFKGDFCCSAVTTVTMIGLFTMSRSNREQEGQHFPCSLSYSLRGFSFENSPP